MEDRIIYFLEVGPCFPPFSMWAYLLRKLHPNDSKLQNYEIFCTIFFFFFRNQKLRDFNSRCCIMNTIYWNCSSLII